jgi:hypothetical protein
MPQYVLKILLDLESRDDIEARKSAAEMVQTRLGGLAGIRDIVLHAKSDNKSIRMNPDGSYEGQWNKGGPGSHGPAKV